MHIKWSLDQKHETRAPPKFFNNTESDTLKHSQSTAAAACDSESDTCLIL